MLNSRVSVGEALECCKSDPTAHSGGSSVDQHAARNVDSENCTHDFSKGSRHSIENWATGHPWYILVKYFPVFSVFQKCE